MFAVLLSRAAFVFPLSWVANCLRRKQSKKIGFNFQMVMWWSGLRGAIAFALAIRNTSTAAHQTILTATLVIVLVTVVFFGGSTVALLQWLRIKYVVSRVSAVAFGHVRCVAQSGSFPLPTVTVLRFQPLFKNVILCSFLAPKSPLL
jgi:NhaP-type Na+/H+ or K+/H+ antiporter